MRSKPKFKVGQIVVTVYSRVLFKIKKRKLCGSPEVWIYWNATGDCKYERVLRPLTKRERGA